MYNLCEVILRRKSTLHITYFVQLKGPGYESFIPVISVSFYHITWGNIMYILEVDTRESETVFFHSW